MTIADLVVQLRDTIKDTEALYSDVELAKRLYGAYPKWSEHTGKVLSLTYPPSLTLNVGNLTVGQARLWVLLAAEEILLHEMAEKERFNVGRHSSAAGTVDLTGVAEGHRQALDGLREEIKDLLLGFLGYSHPLINVGVG
ncbi:MAG: hypothetical protein QXI19_15165 [Candidatus Caldarchaeum sp.]